jgi:Zn-finger nucleic acid-binding protein
MAINNENVAIPTECMVKGEVTMMKCLRCGNVWLSRAYLSHGRMPVACPGCFSHQWNEPYTYHKDGKAAPQRKRDGTSRQAIHRKKKTA